MNLYIQGCMQECIFEMAAMFSTGRYALEMCQYFGIISKEQIC